MTTYQSSVKHIAAPAERIFNKLSDLKQLEPFVERLKEQVPDDKVKIKDVMINDESVYVTMDPMGVIGVKIIEKEPFKTIKFESDKSPVQFNFWIQIVEKEPNDSKIRLTLKADIPFMIRMMIKDKVEQGIEMVAEALTKIEY
ncbi:MAG: SRPBCC family protein [Paludibacteraceae bacterium]|nr:SRPBCC family protein [Paludibacteraceae bacterium]MBQ1852144.1 SRPBCC family protein [Paludibacteraceae bacterium]MBQ2065082.1 SRPBCC family protein [Paludibacteraceae bacterium]MBQ5523919.1 SRPBCC family protein [Paludibacteraceae bacterium]